MGRIQDPNAIQTVNHRNRIERNFYTPKWTAKTSAYEVKRTKLEGKLGKLPVSSSLSIYSNGGATFQFNITPTKHVEISFLMFNIRGGGKIVIGQKGLMTKLEHHVEHL